VSTSEVPDESAPPTAPGVERLQQAIEACLGEVERADPDDEQYHALVKQVLTATDDLLEYEQRLPEVLAAQEQHRDRLVVRASALGCAVLMVVVSIVVLRWDETSNWWLVLTVAGALGSMITWIAEPAAPDDRRQLRVLGTYAWTVGVVAAAVSVFAGTPDYLPVVVPLMVAGDVLMLHWLPSRGGAWFEGGVR
jgi:hypothetical protein